MTTVRFMDRTAKDEARPTTLVWIDSRAAVIVHFQDDRVRLERVESDVPAHHRATGHVRHDPTVRHGGGGSPQTAGEPRRLEHLERFVKSVASRLDPKDELLIIGPGTVRERLARHLLQINRHRPRSRDIACEPSPPLSDRQLIARVRRFAGVEPRKRSVGAHRWTQPSVDRRAGQIYPPPRRVIKPPREGRPEAPDD